MRILTVTVPLLAIAAPGMAQVTPATATGIPNTPLSTSPEPSNGPRAREGDLPTNTAAAAAGGGMQAPPTVTTGDTPPIAPSPDQAFPAPQPAASYPLCRAGQFDQCMEPGNGVPARAATHRRRRARR